MVMFSALALTRTIGQASLGSVVLMASPGFVSMGPSLIADIPVSYFIFASSILMFLFSARKKFELLILSGFMAGLAGWTKNEGLLFIAVSIIALVVASPKNIGRSLLYYLAGLAIPMAVVFYFKSIAPPNDLINNTSGKFIENITDFTRYWVIIKSFALGIFNSNTIILLIYAVIMSDYLLPNHRQGACAITTILLLQLLGYCAIFVITPNDLMWHLGKSLDRLILQILPLGLFLCFSFISDPESIFSHNLKTING
jgi:hypothetical protein